MPKNPEQTEPNPTACKGGEGIGETPSEVRGHSQKRQVIDTAFYYFVDELLLIDSVGVLVICLGNTFPLAVNLKQQQHIGKVNRAAPAFF